MKIRGCSGCVKMEDGVVSFILHNAAERESNLITGKCEPGCTVVADACISVTRSAYWEVRVLELSSSVGNWLCIALLENNLYDSVDSNISI